MTQIKLVSIAFYLLNQL